MAVRSTRVKSVWFFFPIGILSGNSSRTRTVRTSLFSLRIDTQYWIWFIYRKTRLIVRKLRSGSVFVRNGLSSRTDANGIIARYNIPSRRLPTRNSCPSTARNMYGKVFSKKKIVQPWHNIVQWRWRIPEVLWRLNTTPGSAVLFEHKRSVFTTINYYDNIM